jgi:hypothetical protein
VIIGSLGMASQSSRGFVTTFSVALPLTAVCGDAPAIVEAMIETNVREVVNTAKRGHLLE